MGGAPHVTREIGSSSGYLASSPSSSYGGASSFGDAPASGAYHPQQQTGGSYSTYSTRYGSGSYESSSKPQGSYGGYAPSSGSHGGAPSYTGDLRAPSPSRNRGEALTLILTLTLILLLQARRGVLFRSAWWLYHPPAHSFLLWLRWLWKWIRPTGLGIRRCGRSFPGSIRLRGFSRSGHLRGFSRSGRIRLSNRGFTFEALLNPLALASILIGILTLSRLSQYGGAQQFGGNATYSQYAPQYNASAYGGGTPTKQSFGGYGTPSY